MTSFRGLHVTDPQRMRLPVPWLSLRSLTLMRLVSALLSVALAALYLYALPGDGVVYGWFLVGTWTLGACVVYFSSVIVFHIGESAPSRVGVKASYEWPTMWYFAKVVWDALVGFSATSLVLFLSLFRAPPGAPFFATVSYAVHVVPIVFVVAEAVSVRHYYIPIHVIHPTMMAFVYSCAYLAFFGITGREPAAHELDTTQSMRKLVLILLIASCLPVYWVFTAMLNALDKQYVERPLRGAVSL